MLQDNMKVAQIGSFSASLMIRHDFRSGAPNAASRQGEPRRTTQRHLRRKRQTDVSLVRDGCASRSLYGDASGVTGKFHHRHVLQGTVSHRGNVNPLTINVTSAGRHYGERLNFPVEREPGNGGVLRSMA